jgi:hypothetical protein
MADDDGVLGNLPHSRPGTRSEKRESSAAKAPRTSKPRTRAKPAPARAKERPDAERPQPAGSPPPQPSADAVTSVVRTAANVAANGVRVAGAVTQEILRRLPRP